MQRFARLAALGAWGVVAALVLGYAGFIFGISWPNGEGIDRIEAWICWISVYCVVAALVAVHVVFARLLTGVATGQKYSIESSWRVGADV